MSRANEKLISQHVTIFICKRAPARSYKVLTFDEIVDSKTLGFFTILADSYREPRTTLQSQSQLQGLQYLYDSDRTLSSLETLECPEKRVHWSRKFNVHGTSFIRRS